MARRVQDGDTRGSGRGGAGASPGAGEDAHGRTDGTDGQDGRGPAAPATSSPMSPLSVDTSGRSASAAATVGPALRSDFGPVTLFQSVFPS